jgi:hypothetical protein
MDLSGRAPTHATGKVNVSCIFIEHGHMLSSFNKDGSVKAEKNPLALAGVQQRDQEELKNRKVLKG